MKSNQLLSIIGAGGHTRAVIGLLIDNELPIEGFYDTNIKEGEEILGIKGSLIDNLPDTSQLILAIGNNEKRSLFYTKYKQRIYQPTIAHNSAYINSSVVLKNSSLIFPGAHINSCVFIGENNIINTKSIIEHESIIKNNSHISVGSIICGRVEIGNNCFVGAGAIIKDQLTICDNVTIGAGAVVVNNISNPGIYVGNPAKKIR
ncbi:MAG: transferase [Crocinitomicaceae bacterium]|nr:transferase [Crocinitomicaceae bacterium]